MGDKTGIEWTDATWSTIRARSRATGKVGWHCEHVSEGCSHCYAERLNARLGTGLAFKPGHRKDVELFLDEGMLTQPLCWKKPRAVFVCSMTDLFADFVSDAWIDRVFAVMALAPQHTFIVLTKRAKRMRHYLTHIGNRDDLIAEAACAVTPRFDRMNEHMQKYHRNGIMKAVRQPLPNVVLGVSAEDQQRADERIPDLLATPAAKRVVSAEPLLGPIDLNDLVRGSLSQKGGEHHIDALYCDTEPEDDEEYGNAVLDGVILGGESGRGARPMHPDWARSIRDQCAAAGVPFFFKQWGEWLPSESEDQPVYRGEHRYLGGHAHAFRVGKRAAGRLLDGIEHNELPWSLSC